jgi:hypothetical protein
MKKSFIFLIFLFCFIVLAAQAMANWVIDLAPPTSWIETKCGSGAWTSSLLQCAEDIRVRFKCNDGSGSGCNEAYYANNGGSGTCTPPTTSNGSYPSGSGDQYKEFLPPIPNTGGQTIKICGKSSDNAGNTTDANNSVVTIDTLGSWFKLKDASFNNLGSRSNILPASPHLFDAVDDDVSSYLITASVVAGVGQTAGSVLNSTHIDLGSASPDNYSKPANWRDDGTSDTGNFSPANYRDYIKSNKNYDDITASGISAVTLQDDKIHYYSNAFTLNNSNKGFFDGKNLVLLVDGNITIANDFTPSDSVAIISTGTITISSTVKSIKAILVGNAISLPTSSNELKIKGNLISSSAIDTTNRDRTDDKLKPSLFVVFDAKQYIDLLPLLSTSTYDRSEIN